MTDVVKIIGDKKLVSSSSTSETTTHNLINSTETWSNYKEGTGYKKVEIKLNGDMQAPTDDGISAEKTPEQEANLAKLAKAREFLNTPEGAKLAESMYLQQCDISSGQKKWLKKQGIDPDAFTQEWNKIYVESKNNKIGDKAKADANRNEMGTLANTHLGTGNDRVESPSVNEKMKDDRTFFQKIFKIKDKQKVKADEKHGFETATKVNVHSSTDERGDTIERVVGDDIARAGSDYLDAYDGLSNGKRSRTFKEIDENGNIVKTKVIYNKDGTAKKVITKSETNGKLVVKQQKDGDITVKGNLQSDFVYKKNNDIEKIYTDTYVKDVQVTNITNTNNYERTIVEKHNKTRTVYVPTPVEPTPVIPPKKEPITGGLVADFVNDQNPNGMGNVAGATIRTEFADHGAAAMVKEYCSYNDKDAPEQAKKLWTKNAGAMANKYNAEHIAQSLINDSENKKVNEKALGELINELYLQGNTTALKGVKEAIVRHNNQVLKLAPENRGFDAGTRTVNELVSAKELAINWLLTKKDI